MTPAITPKPPQPRKSPREILADPEFRALPAPAQQQILSIADPEFARLSPADQTAILQQSFVGGPATPPRAPVTAGAEAKSQFGAFGQGLKQLLNLGGVGQPSPLGTLGWGLYNTLASAGRELTGSPQPGKSALTAPSSLLGPITGRIPGAASSLLGGDPAAARSNYAAGNKGAAAVDLAAIPATNLALGKLLKTVLPEGEPSIGQRALSLTRATGSGGRSVNIVDAFRTALPDLLESQKLSGRAAATPQALVDLVRDTGLRTQNEFALKMRPIASQEIVPSNTANALRAEAAKFHTGVPADEAIAKHLESSAATFEKPFKLSTLDQIRMNARGRIHGFLSKAPSSQMATLRTNEDIIADQIIHDTIRDTVYDTMENHYHAPDYFRALKRRQSAMLDIADQLEGRMNEIGNKAAFDNFWDRARGHGYFSSGGHMGFSLGNMLGAPFSDEFKVNRAVRKGLAPASNAARRRTLVGGSVAARQSQGTLAPNASEEDQP